MQVRFCSTCNKQTMYKRQLGFGTFFATFITGGSWLLVIPFYPKRRTQCGTTSAQQNSVMRQNNVDDTLINIRKPFS